MEIFLLISDTLTKEKMIDADIQERMDHAKMLRSESGAAKREIALIDQQKEELRKAYGIAPDSQEQKEIEEMPLKKDEPYTEYQMRALELESYKEPYRRIIAICDRGYFDKAGILEEYAVIREMQRERLKKDPMLEASQQAEEILAAASDEIIGMLVEEAKEYIDEKQQEEQKKAEERKEEEKKELEKVEEAREQRRELEEMLYPQEAEKRHEPPKESEVLSGDILTQSLLQMEELQSGVKQKMDSIIQNLNLAAEDLKGIRVDETL